MRSISWLPDRRVGYAGPVCLACSRNASASSGGEWTAENRRARHLPGLAGQAGEAAGAIEENDVRSMQAPAGRCPRAAQDKLGELSGRHASALRAAEVLSAELRRMARLP